MQGDAKGISLHFIMVTGYSYLEDFLRVKPAHRPS